MSSSMSNIDNFLAYISILSHGTIIPFRLVASANPSVNEFILWSLGISYVALNIQSNILSVYNCFN